MPDIHLRADNGQCVCAEGAGGRRDVASRSGSGPWERSEVEYARSHGDTSSGERIEPYLGADGVEDYNDKEDRGADALAAHDEPRAEAAIYDMLDEEREKA